MPKFPRSRRNELAAQRPVSCTFCQLRKLRCSRESPCSNCASRGILCEVLGRPNASPTPINPPGNTIVPEASSNEVLERLRRLEDLVAGLSKESAHRSPDTPWSLNDIHSRPGLEVAIMPPQIQHIETGAIRMERVSISRSLLVRKLFCRCHKIASAEFSLLISGLSPFRLYSTPNIPASANLQVHVTRLPAIFLDASYRRWGQENLCPYPEGNACPTPKVPSRHYIHVPRHPCTNACGHG